MRRNSKALGTLAAATSLSFLAGGLALADTVNLSAASMTITEGKSDTFQVFLAADDDSTDPVDGCSAGSGPSEKVSISFTSSDSNVASAPSGVEITACDNPATTAVEGAKTVTLTALTAGKTTITGTATGGKHVTVSETDKNGNVKLKKVDSTYGADSLELTVRAANTAPALTVPANMTVEGNKTGGADVTYTGLSASDAQDGSVTPTCSPSSASFFALGGPYTVSCSVTDSGGLSDSGSFTVTVKDSTAPSLSSRADVTEEATSASGAAVTYTKPSATDAVDASPVVTCTPESGDTFELGDTTVSCTAKDAAGNTSAPKTFKVTVKDTTAPTDIAFSSTGVQDGQSYLRNFVPAEPTCSASDAVSTPTCEVTGYSSAKGTHTLTATATDAAGNKSTASSTYTVRTLSISAFGSPVDGNGVLNVIKGGNTVPLKFTVFDGSTERKDTAVVSGFSETKIACPGSAAVDEIETFMTTGSTSLRYDTNQFIQNWKTPTGAGTCYRTTVTTVDGSSHSALFKLR